MQQTQLIVCGSIAIDRIMSFKGRFADKLHSAKLDVLSVSILIDGLKVTPGGTAGNIASAGAQLGLEPVLLGSAGKDADAYLKTLKSQGVNTDYVHVSDEHTAVFSVITDDDHNQFGGFYPGAMRDSDSLTLKPWKDSDCLVCISAHDPDGMRRQVAECRQYGLRLFYDPGQQTNNTSGQDLKAGCEAAELIIVNEYEFSLLSEKTGLSETELKNTAEVFVTTKGKNGSVIEGSSLERPIEIKAARPDNVIDPTGAGDSYRVGFLYGLLNGWELEDCGQLASVIASFNVETAEPVPRLSVEAIETRYLKEFNKEIKIT